MKRCLALALLSACASESTTDPGGQPTPPAAAAQAQSDTPGGVATPTPPPDPEPVAAAEPEPDPEPISNDPPVLHLSTFGRCQYGGISAVDGEVFLHHRGGIHRMDEHGLPTEKIADGTWNHYLGVFGRYPDQLYAVQNQSERELTNFDLVHLVDGKQERVNLLGKNSALTAAWPWQNRSILAYGWTGGVDEPGGKTTHRMILVRGEGKGPKLGGVMGRAACDDDPWEPLRAIHVSPTGPVTAVVSCDKTFIATWTPDDRQGKSVPVRHGGGGSAKLALDADGEGYIVLDDKNLLSWKGGQLTPIDRPVKQGITDIALDSEGHPWIAQRDAVRHLEGTEWITEPLPPGSNVLQLAGIEVGSPWLHRKDRSVWNRTPDGQWHQIELSPAGPEDKVPRPQDIVVVRPGDAWINAQYFKMRKEHIGKGMRAMYTQRDVPEPMECGKF